MKKIARKTNKKYQFIPLDSVIAKRIKNNAFRRSFSEEISRLQLAHEIKALRQKKRMTQEEGCYARTYFVSSTILIKIGRAKMELLYGNLLV